MRILKLHQSGRLEVKSIKNELKALQNEVGGYIETVSIFEDADLAVIVDEEGALKMRGKNPFIPGLRGDVIICGVRGDAFTSVPPFKLKGLVSMFGNKLDTK